MSIYNPLSSSYHPSSFLPYKLFHVTASIPVSSSERTPTSSAQLKSGSVFLLSASAAYTAGIDVQTRVELTSFIYNSDTLREEIIIPSASNKQISTSLPSDRVTKAEYSRRPYEYIKINKVKNNTARNIEGPVRITTGSTSSNTTGSIRIGFGRQLRIKDGENFTVKLGCTNPEALNYNKGANVNDGSCILPVKGCMNPKSSNYNPAANIDDGSCAIKGCMDPEAINYNPKATEENGACQYVKDGTFTNTNTTTTHVDNTYQQKKPKTLITKGSILMRTNGEAYVGPYHITAFLLGSSKKQIYVAGHTPSKRPKQFIEGDILKLRNGNRRYIDNNTPLSNNLPTAYKQPTSREQLCSNCIFYDSNKNLNCTKWNAEIRLDYWCSQYQPLEVLIPAGDTFRNEYPGIVQTGLTTEGNEFLLSNKNFYIGSYRIMPDGIYFADDSTPFRRLYLKQILKFGPNKHFTKSNKNIRLKPRKPPTVDPKPIEQEIYSIKDLKYLEIQKKLNGKLIEINSFIEEIKSKIKSAKLEWKDAQSLYKIKKHKWQDKKNKQDKLKELELTMDKLYKVFQDTKRRLNPIKKRHNKKIKDINKQLKHIEFYLDNREPNTITVPFSNPSQAALNRAIPDTSTTTTSVSSPTTSNGGTGTSYSY